MLGFVVWIAVVASVPAAVVVYWRVRWHRAGEDRSRRERTAMMLAAGVMVAAPIALVIQVFTTHVGDEAWALGAVAAGSLATLALGTRAALGNASRGRRRCPSCWYDMAGTPGLVCPECGRDAKREARLFRSRRRKLFVGASLVPLIAGVSLYCVWFLRDHSWVDAVPTGALVVASAWTEWDDPLGREYASRVANGPERTMYGWERWLATRVSRRKVSWAGTGAGGAPGNPRHVLYHAWVLKELGRADETTIATLRALSSGTDPRIVVAATDVLAELPASESVEAALGGLIGHADPQVRGTAINSLLKIKREHPGGVPPERLVSDAAEAERRFDRFRACQLLGLYDETPHSRAALEKAVLWGDALINGAAVVALARHAPDDPAVQGFVAVSLRDPARKQQRTWVIESLLGPDVRLVDSGRELPARRRALYSDAVRGAMLAAEGEGSDAGDDWTIARGLLREHPCFPPDELVNVRHGDAAAAKAASEALPARFRRGPQP